MSQSLRALLVLFAVVGTLAQPALAAEGRGAYAAEVPVAGEEAAQRSEAVGRALRDVLVRVSGDPRAAGAERQVKDPGSLVAEYQYRPADGGTGRLLRVAFDPAAVDAVLRDGGFAVKEEAPRAPDAAPRPLSGSADRVRVQVRGVDSLATYARVNPFGVNMDGPPETVAGILKRARAAGKGLLGMKILGEGKPEVVAKMEESFRFAAEVGVDAMTIGFIGTAQMDEVMGRMAPPA